MRTLYKTYKYLIKPNDGQKLKIKETFIGCTFVYNKYISESKKSGIYKKLAKDILADYKKSNNNLFLSDSSALMNILFKLQDFGEKAKLLKTKRKTINYYTTSNLHNRNQIKIIDNNHIGIPYLGIVEAVVYRDLPKNIKVINGTIIKDNNNSYYFNISFSYDVEEEKINLDINKCIGFDYSSPHFYVDSNGNKSNMQHYYSMAEDKISAEKRKLSNYRKGSINYNKTSNKIKKLYKKSANQRNDSLHKLSTEIANKYDIVCIEDLDMKKIASKFNLAKNTYDNGYSTFVEMLKYKLNERGKKLIVIDKFFPSSKMCNECGYNNNNLKLGDREWTCPNCNTKHDRDVNAAINIKKRGIELYQKYIFLP